MKKFEFLNIVADEQDVDVYINGEIIANDYQMLYDFFGVEGTSPNKFAEMLQANAGKNLTVHINSIGGDVFAGMAMYNAIMDYKGNTTAVVDGICASAATLPLVACTKVKMSAASVLMIHCASMQLAETNKI